MIRLDGVTVTYAGARRPSLVDVDLTVGEGELCLVVGPTGAGKSTLLRTVASLVPHFTGGLVEGTVLVDGRDTRTHLPRDLADVVGVVLQDPAAGFVTDTVEEELAYGMEQLGVPPEVMRRRVEEVLDLLGLAPLRGRPLGDLSGGEQQRVAIGAVLTAQPRVLVLDEPTSALDPTAAEEVLAALTRLVHDLGLTVLLAEHRLERVVQYADRVVLVSPDGTVTDGPPAEVLPGSPVAPPVVELAQVAGWVPVPLSVRDARRVAAPLRERLVDAASAAPTTVPGAAWRVAGPRPRGTRPPLLEARGVEVRHGATRAVRGVDLAVPAGEVVAVMGRNGAGKSSLLWAVQGSGPRSAGTVLVHADPAAPEADGPVGPGPERSARRGLGVLRPRRRRAVAATGSADPARLAAGDARRLVGLVPQEPAQLLYLETVGAECAAADRESGASPGSTAALLAGLAGTVSPDAHPRDLSEGQRLALVLAVQLAARPRVLLLDEPTRGLDYAAKARLSAALRAHADAGGAVVLSSHDVEFVAEAADRVVVLAEGEVVTDGPARDVLVASPTFAPQVAKVLHPVELLTVAAVSAALAAPR